MLISILILILSYFLNTFINNYPVFYTCVLLIITIFYSLISNFARATGYVRQYAAAGVINTLVMGISNILLLVIVRTGMNGYLISMINGQLIAIFYLMLFTKIMQYYNFRVFDKDTLSRLSKYSIPLIPNSVAWWFNSTSDRFFILAMVGASANGIYSLANRIPSLITTLTGIFFQSWQISVVEEYRKKNSRLFISNVFNVFVELLFFLSCTLLAVIRPIFKILLSHNYYEGWKLTPWLLLVVIYSSTASFLGTIYTASKKTVPIMITTIYGAIINIIFSVIFIHIIGYSGAAIANAISFFVVSLLRYRDIYKDGKISISIKEVLFCHIVLLIECIILFTINNDIIVIMLSIILLLLFILINKNFVMFVMMSITKLLKRIF